MELRDLYYSIPLLIVAGGILLTLIVDMFFKNGKRSLPAISFVVLIIAGYYALFTIQQKPEQLGDPRFYSIYNGMLNMGGWAHLFYFLFTFGGAIAVLIATDYLKKIEVELGEYYILLLSSVLGMMLMAGARHLLVLFVGLELMSISFYALAGFRRKNLLSNESALKYFLLGSFATGFLVYGMALMFGGAKSLLLQNIQWELTLQPHNPFLLIGIALFIIGFTFKIAAFPFHMWAPDVYEGAPTSVSALMATLGKAAGFAALILIFVPISTSPVPQVFTNFIAVLSVLSMLYGSLVAIVQKDFKRMLAYSSIAHAGYMLIGLAAVNSTGFAGIVFYLVAYTFMNLGAFAIISVLESKDGKYLKLSDYKGLGSRQPALAAALAIFMFALSGIPPFAGFFGKYFIFLAAVQSHQTWLALLGVLSSVISVYFYLQVIVLMYFTKSEEDLPVVTVSQSGVLAIVVALVLVISLGVAPNSLIQLIRSLI